jgi:tetratricopeptide (TPR) repeat protein
MKRKIQFLSVFFLNVLISWPGILVAQENIPMVEIDGDRTSSLSFDVPGQKIVIPDFLNRVQENIPSNLSVTSVTSYLADLKQDGNGEILSMAIADARPVYLLVFDTQGKFLASKAAGNGDEIYWGVQKKGFPLIFGYKTDWAASAGYCEWEFDVWDGQQIKTVLGLATKYGKGGDEKDPSFKYLPEKDTLEVVTDNGKKFWDKTQMAFTGGWQRLDEDETLADCPPVDKKLSILDKGKFYFRHGEYDCAQKAYVLAIGETSKNYEAWQYLGYLALVQGDNEYAITCFNTSVEMNPTYGMGHYNLALAYWADGNKAKSVNELKILYGLDPQYKKLVMEDSQFEEIIQSKEYQNMVKGL